MKKVRLSWPVRVPRRRSLSDYRIKVNRRIRGISTSLSPDTGRRSSNASWGGKTISYSQEMWRRPGSYEKFEEECQERCEAAYRYGFEDGKKIGFREGTEQIKESVNYIKNVAGKILDKRESILSEAENMIVRLALSVARTILRREAQIDQGLVKSIARASLKLIEDKKRVSIKVHPSNWDALKEFEADILNSTHGVKELDIKEDIYVSPGGCVIETDSGIIDAQLNTQVDEIAANLMEAV